ncbi:MAG TPA: hypothetical protein PK452_10855 [Amaricoccus sp.]|uniref:hypothetical protein n=1 Tax=Amaricoccus sp. TaxID=1872485 RepID=UPI002BC1E106|nr:hypothetical protein [Amaricoccus sp.]HRO12022.1 hypothetical protein [Amaricoccus sp.]
MDTQSLPSTPPAADQPVLAELVAAGLVSHEMIGDPARLGSEAEALKALCTEIGGPVWRLDAFHYAFRARPEDLGGTLAAIPAADWTAAIETALRNALGGEPGAEAVWISATDLLPDAALPEAPLLLLRAEGEAVAAGLAAAGPGTQAVIHARFAVEAARLAAGAEPGSALARRLAVIETRQEEILEMLVERAEEAATLGRLAATLAGIVERLDAQGAALAGLAAETGALSSRVAALAAAPDAPDAAAEAAAQAAFRRDLGLALAEFLARLEQEAALRPPLAPALAPRLG